MRTKEILKEWRSFLNESKLTDVNYEKDQEVKIKICCGGCATAASVEGKFTAKKDDSFSGKVVAPNLGNRPVSFDNDKSEKDSEKTDDKASPGENKDTEVNFVLVDIGSKGEQSFPQCCIDLGMKEND